MGKKMGEENTEIQTGAWGLAAGVLSQIESFQVPCKSSLGPLGVSPHSALNCSSVLTVTFHSRLRIQPPVECV